MIGFDYFVQTYCLTSCLSHQGFRTYYLRYFGYYFQKFRTIHFHPQLAVVVGYSLQTCQYFEQDFRTEMLQEVVYFQIVLGPGYLGLGWILQRDCCLPEKSFPGFLKMIDWYYLKLLRNRHSLQDFDWFGRKVLLDCCCQLRRVLLLGNYYQVVQLKGYSASQICLLVEQVGLFGRKLLLLDQLVVVLQKQQDFAVADLRKVLHCLVVVDRQTFLGHSFGHYFDRIAQFLDWEMVVQTIHLLAEAAVVDLGTCPVHLYFVQKVMYSEAVRMVMVHFVRKLLSLCYFVRRTQYQVQVFAVQRVTDLDYCSKRQETCNDYELINMQIALIEFIILIQAYKFATKNHSYLAHETFSPCFWKKNKQTLVQKICDTLFERFKEMSKSNQVQFNQNKYR